MALTDEPLYEYKNNPHYIEFSKEKELIKEKYPPRIFDTETSRKHNTKDLIEYTTLGDREIHKKYLNELLDLIFQPEGNYQKFTWDMIGEVQQLEMERRARGRLYSSEYMGE